MSNLPKLLPILSHSSLLEWWFNSKSIVSNSTREASFEISSLLDHISHSSTLTSGFEFHHYSSTRLPDYLVFLSSSDLLHLPENSLPSWWSRYMSVLSAIRDNSSFSLIPENWLEFDYCEPHLVLNGLWQRVFEPKRSFDINIWYQLAECISGSFISYDSLVSHPIVIKLIEMFSLPQQIGLMHGRSQNLKLMFQLDSRILINNFHSFVLCCTPQVREIFIPILDFLLNYGTSLRPAISVDIDLTSNLLIPENISIEIHQAHQIGRILHQESINFLDSILNISDFQISSLYRLLENLPYGESFSFSRSDSSLLVLNNISRLNHIKVQFRNGDWQLKSYVKLIQSLS